MLCDQCQNVIYGVPWVAMRQGKYAYLCTPECKEQHQNETHRIAWTQRSLDLGRATFNGS